MIKDRSDDQYEETDFLLEVRTKDGLKAKIHYTADLADYRLYISGNVSYGLVYFYLYKLHSGYKMDWSIGYVGRPSELTYS